MRPRSGGVFLWPSKIEKPLNEGQVFRRAKRFGLEFRHRIIEGIVQHLAQHSFFGAVDALEEV